MRPKFRARRAIPVIDPVADFLKTEEGGGFALFAGSVVALLWVNLLGIDGYESFWHTKLTIGFGEISITEDLGHWVNDGLMTLFFFLISLEIKREIVHGDLREPRKAALPVLAAAGGVLVPVAIFLAVTAGTDGTSGWGIPMATDAAFAIAALAILGDRVGVGAKLFLVTIAVVDDILAIAVIAIAYTSDLSLPWLLASIGTLGIVAAMRRLGIGAIWPYAIVGVLVWIAVLESGVHATIAGVALAFLTPAKPIDGRQVIEELEERIHPWTSFLVLPVFALANAGVVIGGDALGAGDGARVAVAVALGLVAGKLIGISAAAWLALRLRIGALPEGLGFRSVIGIAALAGIGFTVSLFIAALAYDDPLLVDAAKLGILGGSVVSAAIGVAILAPGGRHPSRAAPEG
ncbi:MAG: Na+/H+ antiporter NhaA [Solirubrobacterales bacterium]